MAWKKVKAGRRRAGLKRWSSNTIKVDSRLETGKWYSLKETGDRAKSASIPLPLTRGISKSELEVAHKMNEEWHGVDRHHGLNTYPRIIVEDKVYVKVYMYFSGKRFYFLEVKPLHKTMRMSGIYTSKEAALHSFNRDVIKWDEPIPLTEVAG